MLLAIHPGPDARIFRISRLRVTYEVRTFTAIFIVVVCFENTNGLWFVYNRVGSLQDQIIQRLFLPIVKDVSKTFESNQLSKNCVYKHHFYQVISPVKSHPKMHPFVDICENIASINLFYQVGIV
jgi:hypothetical protein